MATTGQRRIVTTTSGELNRESGALQFRRLIGVDDLPRLDPFLTFHDMTDDGTDGDIAEFATHPHRGFVIVTHMIAGHMRHGGPTGDTGQLPSGAIQWLTAGRGIVHSERLEREAGAVRCTQLWLNLPARHKMDEPVCHTIEADSIPTVEPKDGVRIGIVAGAVGDVTGTIRDETTQAVYLDIALAEGASVVQDLPAGHAAFIYVLEGTVALGPEGATAVLRAGDLGVLSDGNAAALAAECPTRLLMVAGRPINETVVQLGPFVMNTQEEIQQAIADYKAGRF